MSIIRIHKRCGSKRGRQMISKLSRLPTSMILKKFKNNNRHNSRRTSDITSLGRDSSEKCLNSRRPPGSHSRQWMTPMRFQRWISPSPRRPLLRKEGSTLHRESEEQMSYKTQVMKKKMKWSCRGINNRKVVNK
jgi:hypothetical protein